jgi:hypothetical protein
MKKKLELTLDQAQSIYKTADAGLKEILEANFGKTNLIGRPIGVWCLTDNNQAIKAEDWRNQYRCIGVGVVTDKTAFILSLVPQAALPFGSTNVEKYDDVVYDTGSYDNAAATDCIIEAHEDEVGKMWNNDKFPFKGAPAAEYCVKQGGALPTLATAKEIAANIKDINEAMMAVGGAVVCGWLWTSTVQKCNNCAFVVDAPYGDVINDYRDNISNARAVSAFRFEDFKF